MATAANMPVQSKAAAAEEVFLPNVRELVQLADSLIGSLRQPF